MEWTSSSVFTPTSAFNSEDYRSITSARASTGVSRKFNPTEAATRVFDNGMSIVHVITTAEADILVTAWISGRLDLGV